ncbi:hypothetical protein TYRP_012834 [Tyrophagus putrescentiae]|nr:hypothetical protein TYRP_012834 [Tyrophagus putrescentiae]
MDEGKQVEDGITDKAAATDFEDDSRGWTTARQVADGITTEASSSSSAVFGLDSRGLYSRPSLSTVLFGPPTSEEGQ